MILVRNGPRPLTAGRGDVAIKATAVLARSLQVFYARPSHRAFIANVKQIREM